MGSAKTGGQAAVYQVGSGLIERGRADHQPPHEATRHSLALTHASAVVALRVYEFNGDWKNNNKTKQNKTIYSRELPPDHDFRWNRHCRMT